MEKTLTWWPSPAKLNLFLHINGRREDGYHELQSIFQLLDFGDKLAFNVTENANISLQTPIEGVPAEQNLIVRAAKLLQQHCQTKHGCEIWLDKVLPMGGGIGGGSSNAATTLVVLNELWNCHLDINTLAELGLSLGADVPIFVRGFSAFAQGVGEIIEPVELPHKHYLVIYPNCHVSTAEIFQSPSLPRNTAKIKLQDYQFHLTNNDCQKLVTNRHPKVAKLLHWLLEYAPSRMTGTGACLFAVFDDLESARKVYKRLPEGCFGFVASGVNRSLLHKQIEKFHQARDSK